MRPSSLSFSSWRRSLKRQRSLIILSALSMALLCGSLMVGFSVEKSLEGIGFDRLGKARFMITPPAGISRELADAFAGLPGSAASLTPAKAVSVSAGGISLPGVFVYGVNQDFFDLYSDPFEAPEEGEIIINRHLADRLELSVGSDLIINLKNDPLIPVEIPLSEGEYGKLTMTLKIREILPDKGPGNFSITIGSQIDDIVYMNHRELSREIERPHRYSMVLLSKMPEESLDAWIPPFWDLLDLNLFWEDLGESAELRSHNLFIPHDLFEVIEELPGGEMISSGFLTSVEGPENDTPYSFFTSDPDLDDGAIISSWLAGDSGLEPGDRALLRWWSGDEENRLVRKEMSLTISSLSDDLAMASLSDRLPDFPGLNSAASCSLWDPGIPVDMDRIRDKDEQWWNRWGAAPRIILPLEAAREINGSSYGSVTGVRFPKKDMDFIEKQILSTIQPTRQGYNSKDLYEAVARGSREGVDFSSLFTGLNFFLITSCLYLLYQSQLMALGKRKRDLFILKALGYERKQLYKWFLLQQSASISLALIPGTVLAGAYQFFVISSLNSLWSGAVAGTALSFAWNLPLMAAGLLSAWFLSLFCAFLAVKKYTVERRTRKSRRLFMAYPVKILIPLLSVLSAVAAYYLYVDRENQVPAFFVLAMSLLFLGFSFFHLFFLDKSNHGPDTLKALALAESRRKKNMLRSQFLLYSLSLFLLLTLSLPFGSGSSIREGAGDFAMYGETAMPYVSESASISIPGLDGTIVGMRKQNGDDASCLNLNRVFQPSVLGVPYSLFDGEDGFAFSHSLEKENIWSSLGTSREDGRIPAIADATVLTWNLKVSVGDTMTIKDGRGIDRELIFIAALSSSIFQGNVLIGENRFRELFPRSGGYSVLLFGDSIEPDTAQRLLKPWGVSLSGTAERLEHFAEVEHSYLKIFVNLGFIALILGSLGTGFHLISRIRGDESFWSLLGVLGYGERQRWIWLFYQSFPPLLWAFATAAFSVVIPMSLWSLSGNLTIDWIWFFTVIGGLMLFTVLLLYAVFRSLLKIPLLRSLRNI